MVHTNYGGDWDGCCGRTTVLSMPSLLPLLWNVRVGGMFNQLSYMWILLLNAVVGKSCDNEEMVKGVVCILNKIIIYIFFKPK